MPLRGLTKEQEQAPSLLIRDTRTLGQRTRDFFEEPSNAALVIVALSALIFVYPEVSDLVFLICFFIFVYSYNRSTKLPFRMPKRSQMLDYNDIRPGSTKPNFARGITYYGNEISTNQELWFTNDDMRTHTLIFGSTGSGKTEALISLCFNSLIQGSGFIYVDGKGDNTLFAKIFSMVRSIGREDDILLINFMTGARDVVGPQERRLSNTLNPFCRGSSGMLSQLVVSLMSESSQSPDGDMWKGRAISFVEALMKVLVYMRDQGKLLLDANTIRNYFELEGLESIVVDKVFPRRDQESVSLADAPPGICEPLYNYVINLPGYSKGKKGKQVSQVYEQHGFITMQLTRVFTSLADTYGHILRTRLAEVDLRDVVLNRRILVVLLPALEKSPEELANLGKVIIASLKTMMASGLGEEVEGYYKDVVLRKPTNAPSPYMCILDEYGYYAVKGFAVVPAQARSLGFSVIFAGQDLPAFQKASKEEAASIGANTNIKIAMKLEDPIETWDFFSKTAGESYVTKVDSFQTDASSMMNYYLDAKSASAEKRARVDLLDLKEQREGEAHIFFKSTIVRAKMFYANPEPAKRMRLNQFLKVEQPFTRILIELETRLRQFGVMVSEGKLAFDSSQTDEDLGLIVDALRTDQAPSYIERCVAGLLAYHNKHIAPAISDSGEPLIEQNVQQIREHDLDIFSRVALTDLTKELITESDIPYFSTSLLQKSTCREQIIDLMRFSGNSDQDSSTHATEIVRDMEIATYYPPKLDFPTDIDHFVIIINELSSSLQEMGGGTTTKVKGVDDMFDDL